MTFEQGHGAVQAVDGRAQVLARALRQLSHQRDLSQQLQGIPHVLDRPLGVGYARLAAATVERAAPLRAAAPVDDATALFFCSDDGDRLPARLSAAVGAGATISPKSGEH